MAEELKLGMHGNIYTEDEETGEWKSGEETAKPPTAAMLDMLAEKLSPQEDEEIEGFIGTANVVPKESEQKTREQIKAEERAEEAQQNMENPPEPPIDPDATAVKPVLTAGMVAPVVEEVVNQERPFVENDNPIFDRNMEPVPAPAEAVSPPKPSNPNWGEPISFPGTKEVIKPGDPRYNKIMGPPPAAPVTETVKPAEPLVPAPELIRAKPKPEADADAEAVKAEPTEGITLPKPEVAAEEQTVGQTPVAERTPTRREKIKQEFDTNFAQELSTKVPAIKMMTDKASGKSASGMEAITDASDNIAELFGDIKSGEFIKKFKKKEEPLAQRESLEKLTDLSPQEIKRLEERGIAPASEKDFSYRKEGKPVSKEDILKELNTDATEQNTRLEEEANKPKPFYQRKAEQLKEQFSQSFKGHLREKLPLLRLFTDKLDEEGSPEAAAGAAQADAVPEVTKDAETTSTEAVDSLKSIDKNIEQIVGILKDSKKEKEEDDKEEEQKEKEEDKEEAEQVKEKTQQASKLEDDNEESQESAALEKLEQREDAEPVNGESGTKPKKRSRKAKETLDKIKENLSASAEPAAAAEAEAVPAAAEGAAEAAGSAAAEAVAGGGMLKGIKGIAKLIPGLGKLAKFLPFANGGVVENAHAVKLFADGGVVDQPTAFSHKGGTGIMGEAGAEAIMPLKRGPDGKLGVQTADAQKPPITDQTKMLSDAQDMRQAKQDEKTKAQPTAAAPTIINSTTNNNQSGGGGGGGYVPTAGARNSLDLFYYA